MVSKKLAEPSAESVARADRQRLAREEGVRAMEDVARDAASIRKNMERLRALRLAREAEQALLPPVESVAPPKKRAGRPSKSKIST
jgi:CRISPR/Cas system-associated protein Csm6